MASLIKTITQDRIVYDSRGRLVPVVSKPVGWSRHEMPAVQIDGSLVLIDDLMKYAWGGESTLIAPSRIPGQHYENEEN